MRIFEPRAVSKKVLVKEHVLIENEITIQLINGKYITIHACICLT